MGIKKKITISWSGGKDSAFALYRILLSGEYKVIHLHTVFSEDHHRVALHGVHESLIEQQARILKLPLVKLYLPSSENHEAYKELIKSFYRQCAKQGIEAVVFGDIFLEDLRIFRESMLRESGLHGIFPLWKADSKMLMDDFLNSGFKTVVCSANAKYFQKESLGKTIDEFFLKTLPPSVDPCGENGEFHTFVYDGPLFHEPVAHRLGKVISKHYDFNVTSGDGSIERQHTEFFFRELLAAEPVSAPKKSS
jgi:uncharacterized protein (TIGR00290 family)